MNNKLLKTLLLILLVPVLWLPGKAQQEIDISPFILHKIKPQPDTSPFCSLQFSKDKNILYAFSEAYMYRIDINTGEQIDFIDFNDKPPSYDISHTAMTKDGNYIVIATKWYLMLYDTETWEQVWKRKYKSGGSEPNEMVVSPDDSLIITGGSIRDIQAYDLMTGKFLKEIGYNTCDIEFSPDGKSLYSMESNNHAPFMGTNLYEYDTETLEEIRKVHLPYGHNDYFSLTPDSKHILLEKFWGHNNEHQEFVWDSSVTRLYDLETFNIANESSASGYYFGDKIVYIPNLNNYLLSGFSIVDYNTKGMKKWDIQPNISHIPSLRFSPDSSLIAGAIHNTIFIISTDFVLLDIEDKLIEKELNIFPNPAEDKVTIEFDSELNSTIEIELINQLGVKLISYEKANSGSIQLDLPELPHGLYFLRIRTGSSYITKKLIIGR